MKISRGLAKICFDQNAKTLFVAYSILLIHSFIPLLFQAYDGNYEWHAFIVLLLLVFFYGEKLYLSECKWISV